MHTCDGNCEHFELFYIKETAGKMQQEGTVMASTINILNATSFLKDQG
jgi:hypothetical protein